MKTIADSWREYVAKAYPNGLPDAEYVAARKAFMFGASVGCDTAVESFNRSDVSQAVWERMLWRRQIGKQLATDR